MCRNLLLCVLSIDFALSLNIMLLEPEKWMVPKCSTIQNSARKGGLLMPQAKLISPITRQEIRKIRVAAYCRVSSNSADQQNSYANQIRVYTSLIQRKKEWELVEIFADEGLSLIHIFCSSLTQMMVSHSRRRKKKQLLFAENKQIHPWRELWWILLWQM